MSENEGHHGERVIEEIRSLPLPSGWARTSVEEVGVVRLGRQRSPKNRSADFPTKYIRAANITWTGLDLSDVLDMDFRPEERASYRLQPGDVLLSEASGSASEVGKPAIWNGELEDCCFQNTVIRFRPKAVTSKFALLAFQHFARNSVFARVSKGVGIHHLSADRFASMPFLLPPEQEQVRIVAKAEELFSNLDAGIVALKRAKANLKSYRAAVLKAAVEGKLTEDGAHSSFRADAWSEIGTVLTCVEQGWSPKCDREAASSHREWAVMKTSAVLPMQFLEDENKRLPTSLTPEPDLEVKVNDLLITRAGPRNRAAVTCLVRSCRPRLIVCDKIYRMRCNPSKATPAFLEIVLNSPPVIDELDELKTGISDSGVNLTQQRFRRLRVPVPPLSIQEQIVNEVEERLSILASSEAAINHGLLRAARLRQSILKQAFEGKLVPQDPTDEPASVLLERLKNATPGKMTSTNGPSGTRSHRRSSTKDPE